jgi:nucleoside-diphosphate-sugar epimerase
VFLIVKTAIITGATGFLGFALVRELIQNGVQVCALCRKGSRRISRLGVLANVQIVEVDLNNLDSVNGISGDVFFHAAWEGGRNEFTEQYRNVSQTINCVGLAARLGCKRFVGFGSQAEYGSTTVRITEETPLKPTTAYGSCKVAAYYLSSDLAKRLGIEFVWARVFSIYGKGDNANSLFPQLVESLRTNGEFSLVTDGSHKWNYLHEEDAAKALRLLGQNESGVYNVASRECKPLREYVEAVRHEINPNGVVRYGTEKCDVWLDVSTEKLRKCIGEFEGIESNEFRFL